MTARPLTAPIPHRQPSRRPEPARSARAGTCPCAPGPSGSAPPDPSEQRRGRPSGPPTNRGRHTGRCSPLPCRERRERVKIAKNTYKNGGEGCGRGYTLSRITGRTLQCKCPLLGRQPSQPRPAGQLRVGGGSCAPPGGRAQHRQDRTRDSRCGMARDWPRDPARDKARAPARDRARDKSRAPERDKARDQPRDPAASFGHATGHAH